VVPAGVRALSLNGGYDAEAGNRRLGGIVDVLPMVGRPEDDAGAGAPPMLGRPSVGIGAGVRGRTGPLPSPPGGVFGEFTRLSPRKRPPSQPLV
jgi:hypothetical protein